MLGRPGNNLKSGIVCELCPHRLVFFFSHPTSPFFFSLSPINTTFPFFLFFFSFSSFINHAVITGWFGQCWQVDTLPGYYQVVAG